MHTTQHNKTRCPVYLHPAAATNPAAIDAIQRQTGLLIIVGGPHFARLGKPQPAAIELTSTDFDPWGGSAA